MAEGFGHLAVQAILAFGIYGALVVSYTLLGAWKNINIWQMRWDWKLWVGGLAKYLLLGAAVLVTMFSSYSTLYLMPQWGVEVPGAQQIGTKVIFGVIAAGIAAMLLKNIQKVAEIIGVPPETVAKLQERATKIEPDEPLVIEAPGLLVVPPDYIEQKLKDEEIGGIGRVYSVPIGSYDEFRAAVIGKGFDIDGQYGEQCWDGAALLWQQLGLNLYTGNGLAIGCWDLKRDVNKYDQFDLVANVADLRRGDVVCMRPNHIGFFDGWDGQNMRILGQNQNGTLNGAPFSVVTIARAAFAGAFRYKGWATPAAPAKKTNEQIADEVIRGLWGNGEERKRRLAEAGYDYASVQAIVNEKLGAPKVGVDVVPAPAAAPGDIVRPFKVGDTVVPTKLVDWDGRKLRQYDPYYTISELKGKRAVLMARGQVWAAVSTDNLRHA